MHLESNMKLQCMWDQGSGNQVQQVNDFQKFTVSFIV
jgi:hypothetical protein